MASEPSRGPKNASLPGHPPTAGILAVAASGALWAIAANVARSLFDDGVPPVELAASRAWIAFLGLSLVYITRRSPAPSSSSTGDTFGWPRLLALGLSIGMVNAVYYVAIQRLDVAVAVTLEYTAPALVVLWVSLSARRRPAPEVLAAVVAAVLGVALLSEVFSVDLSDLDGLGLGAGLSAAFFFAAYTLLSEQANATYGALGAMFRGFAVTTVFWLLVQATRGWPAELFDTSNLPRVLYVGIFGTIVPFLLYVWGIGHVRSERASIAATLEPAIAAAIAWVWLDQELTVGQIAGTILVLGAVIALQLRRTTPPIAPEP